MRFLNLTEVLELHDRVIDQTGGQTAFATLVRSNRRFSVANGVRGQTSYTQQ